MNDVKTKGIWSIILLVGCFFLFFMIFAVYTVSNMKGIGANIEGFSSGKNKKAPIAVVEVEGVILESKSVVEKLHKAEEDKNAKAIIVRIDSPGGAVGPTQEIYQEIRRIDKVKPVYASFGTVAASGGYYIGAAARKIFSNPGTLTGSIGVIMQFVEMSRLYDFLKVKPTTIKSGIFKDIGNPSRPMTAEERSLLKTVTAKVHGQFRSDILKARKGKIKGDLSKYAEGQIFSGEEAYNYGLVDELQGLWGAARKIHEELKIEEDFGVKFIKKSKKIELMELIENFEGMKEMLNIKRILFNGMVPNLM